MDETPQVLDPAAAARKQMYRERMAKARAAKEARKANGESPPPRKAKRKIKARAAARPKTPNRQPADWLAGIAHAPNGCPPGCNAEFCVISHENVCAHPDTSLQAKYLTPQYVEVFKRFKQAQAELARIDAERTKVS